MKQKINFIEISINFGSGNWTDWVRIEWNQLFIPDISHKFPFLGDFITEDIFSKIREEDAFPKHVYEASKSYNQDNIKDFFSDYTFRITSIHWRKKNNVIYPILYLRSEDDL